MRSVKWHLTKLSRGIRQANISNDDILELELAAPEKTLQERFVEVVETHQAMRRKTGEAIRQADHLFDTLLQRAFRGELWLAR